MAKGAGEMKTQSEIMDHIRELIFDKKEAATKFEQVQMFYDIASDCEIEAEAMEADEGKEAGE